MPLPNSASCSSRSPQPSYRSIRVDLTLILTFLVVLTAGSIICYSYNENTRAALTMSRQLMSRLTDAILEKTNHYFLPAVDFSKSASQILHHYKGEKLLSAPLARELLVQALKASPQVEMLYLCDPDGHMLLARNLEAGSYLIQTVRPDPDPDSDRFLSKDVIFNPNGERIKETPLEPTRFNPLKRPWFTGAVKARGPHWTSVYTFFDEQVPGITSSYAAFDKEENLVGVAGVDYTLAGLSKFLDQTKSSPNGITLIVDGEDNLIACPGLTFGAIPHSTPDSPSTVACLENPVIMKAFRVYGAEKRTNFGFSHQGEDFLAFFRPMPEQFGRNWCIFVLSPERDFVGPIEQTSRTVMLVSLIILAAAGGVAAFISKGFSRPVEQLSEEAAKVGKFDLDDDIPTCSSYREIQQLSNSMNAMKKALRAFAKYVPTELVHQLIKSGKEVKLGGVEQELTISFSDIEGFTSISEGQMPLNIMEHLSEYLKALTTIIREENGTVDKYIGDSVMAFWGAPLPNPSHARDACMAALRCNSRIETLNGMWKTQGRIPLPTRFGLHTGTTMVGNVGSSDRMNYTVLGDSVNLASRLEGTNKLYGTRIIVSETTHDHAGDEFVFRPLDRVAVKGKTKGILVYELLGLKEDLASSPALHITGEYSKALDFYFGQKWSDAIEILEELLKSHPDDLPSQNLLKRCKTYAQTPPPEDWQGVFQMREKA